MNALKSYGLAFLTGTVITILLTVTMLQITMDFRILLFLSSVLYFIGGFLNAKTNGSAFVKVGLILLVYSTLFIVLVLEQLPSLYYFVFFFIISSGLGMFFSKNQKEVKVSALVVILLMSFASIKLIPKAIEKQLTTAKNDPLPQFEMKDMNGNFIKSKDFEGKVVLLDFFGNWCAPCIQELKELDRVQRKFESNKNVLFYVINANFGGDTPEKFQTFIDKKNYNFTYAYDYESKIYNLLKLPRGGSLPALMIVDKNQTIRMLHIGYNRAETNFSKNLTQKIEQLLREKQFDD